MPYCHECKWFNIPEAKPSKITSFKKFCVKKCRFVWARQKACCCFEPFPVMLQLRRVGFLRISYGESYIDIAYNADAAKPHVRIDAIEVEEKERGKGLGRALVQIAEDIGKLLGCKIIVTSTVFKESRGFWEKLGYKPIHGWDLCSYYKELT